MRFSNRDKRLLLYIPLLAIAFNIFYFFYEQSQLEMTESTSRTFTVVAIIFWTGVSVFLGWVTAMISLLVKRKEKVVLSQDDLLDSPISKTHPDRRTILFAFIWMVLIQISYTVWILIPKWPHSLFP